MEGNIHFRKQLNDIFKKRKSNNMNISNSEINKIINNENKNKEDLNNSQNKELEEKKNENKKIDPKSLVYNSPYLPKSKINDYNGLCEDLKTLEIQLYVENRIKNTNNLNIGDELESEVALMKKKSELNDFGYDFYNIEEIFKIIDIVKKPPEIRTMEDLLKIVKYLTTTKLGKYFKEEFEQKDIYEKLMTFCGVELRYKLIKKGETIFKIGELPDNFYMVLFGKVEVLKPFPKNITLTGYQYFCYLMNLKKLNDEYLFYLSIQENLSSFYIKKEEAKDLHYIYLLNIVDKISRNKKVDFAKALNISGITCDELDLDPNEITSNKYILENIKKIKRRLPDISGAITLKYLFLDDKIVEKNIIIYDYYKFLNLEAKSHFGDSAMDSNTTRNATIIAEEDTHVAFINNNLYYKNVVVEKAAVIDRKIQFLNSNFIFGKINQKKFEKRYFGLFICNNYKKGDIIFNEGDKPYYVYFIEQGDVELFSSKNIFEFQKVIDYLEKERKNFLKNKIIDEKEKEKQNDEDNKYIYTYDKINFDCSELKEQINKKEKKRILLLKDNEDLGMLSFYFGYPYLTSAIVSSSFAKIYKIDNKYLSEMIIKEKECYKDLVKRIEDKISLFHERFFSINNMKLILADNKKMMEQKELKNQTNKYTINNDSTYNKEIKEVNGHSIIRDILKENNKPPITKNDFNKNNIIKINYHKLKEIFNKTSYINQSLENNNNNEQKTNFPIIKYKNLQSYIDVNDNEKDFKIINKNNSQKNILTGNKGVKRIYNKRSIEKIKNRSKNNIINPILNMNSFNNKSCIFLNQTNYCIDPVLKQNYSNYENLFSNNRYLQPNNSFIKRKNESMEEPEIKTQLFFNHHNLVNKFMNKNYLNNLKSFYNNSNSTISYKSSSANKNIENYSKDDDNYNNISSNKKNNIINIVNIDNIFENKKNKEINNYNHPYYAPLVLNKKEKYKIFTDDMNKKLRYEKRLKKELNKKKGLNEFGYPFDCNKKFHKNRSYRNDYLVMKIKGNQYYKELVEKNNKK